MINEYDKCLQKERDHQQLDSRNVSKLQLKVLFIKNRSYHIIAVASLFDLFQLNIGRFPNTLTLNLKDKYLKYMYLKPFRKQSYM